MGNAARPQKKPSAASAKRKKKKGAYIRIGNKRYNLKFFGGIALVLVAALLIIILTSGAPDLYTLQTGSITIHSEAQAVLIKDEAGYSYAEDSTLVNHVADGTAVEKGDTVATLLSSELTSSDYFTQLDIARRNTIEYMRYSLNDEVTLNAVSVIDSQITRISQEMVRALSVDVSQYASYSQELMSLYNQRRDILLEAYGTDQNIQDYLSREDLYLNRITSNTLNITAIKDGIVSFNTDGYANVYNAANIDTLTSAQVTNILEGRSSSSVTSQRKASQYYISNMNSLYLAFNGDASHQYLREEDTVLIRFSANGEQYSATVYKAEHTEEGSFIILYLEAPLNELYRTRTSTIYMEKRWNGPIISKDLVVTKRGVQGVNLYIDKKKVFTEIEILAENDTHLILDTANVNSAMQNGVQIVVP